MSTQGTKEEEDEKEVQNSQENQNDEENDKSNDEENDENNDKNNEAYFLILIPSEEKIDFQGLSYKTKNMINPSIIFKDRIEKDDKTYLEEIVFKFKKKKRKKRPTTKMNQENQLNMQLYILKKNTYIILHLLRKMNVSYINLN